MGYRVNSLKATHFRIWATNALREFMVKGFVLDDQMLKRQANVFELRYGKTVMPECPGWELCEKVLSRRDAVERLSTAW